MRFSLSNLRLTMAGLVALAGGAQAQITQYGQFTAGPNGVMVQVSAVLSGEFDIGAIDSPADGVYASGSVRIVGLGEVLSAGGSRSTVGSESYTYPNVRIVCLGPGSHTVQVEIETHAEIGDDGDPAAAAVNQSTFDSGGFDVVFTEVALEVYCTAGISALGCQAQISATGCPSVSSPQGFELEVTGLPGQRVGLFFYGTNGRQANPWGTGSSFQCIVPPVLRTGVIAGSGSKQACDGVSELDLNSIWCTTCPKPQVNPGIGIVVLAQFWYRDPLHTSNQTTSLSDAVELVIGK